MEPWNSVFIYESIRINLYCFGTPWCSGRTWQKYVYSYIYIYITIHRINHNHTTIFAADYTHNNNIPIIKRYTGLRISRIVTTIF